MEEKQSSQNTNSTPPVSPVSTQPKVSATAEGTTRRDFIWTAWAAFAAFVAGAGASAGRFMMPNVLYEAPQIFKAGRPEDYSEGVSTKWMKEQRVWIVRTGNEIYALWGRCTHLGCTPNWFDAEKRFKCPCHGSNFSAKGDVIAGPAPKPLNRCAIALLPTGELLVDKSILETRPGFREKKQFVVQV